MDAANRVATNTMILYGRMLVTMGLTLYSTKIVLNALGSMDYGIFNLIAGIIVMLSFLNTAMATSSQRYLSYHQGKQNISMQKAVFANSFFLHIVIGLIVVLVLEICGLFLFNGFLNIPISRIGSAKIIYHYMALTVFFTIVTVPFNALLIAHENMIWVAVVNIVDALLKLLIALFLYRTTADKLIVYGMLTASIVLLDFILFSWFCLKRYPECTIKGLAKPDKGHIKELSSFAGWNLFGALCNMGRNEGMALILNLFFGAIVNAAYGIANQVGAQLLFFSGTMLRALDPQIMKSEGAGDRNRMLRLAMMASKFSFILFAVFSIPLIFEMNSVLHFWLKNVPDNTVIFCKLMLIGSLINQLTIGLQSAMQAQGDIKLYQTLVGGILLLNLPIAYLLLKIGDYPPYVVLVSYVVIQFFSAIMRMFLARAKLGMSIKVYLNAVLVKQLIPLLTVIIVDILLVRYTHLKYRFVFTILASVITYSGLIVLFGLDQKEKLLLQGFIRISKQKFLINNR